VSSLADLPEVVGFFSYSRDDDEGFGHQLSSLRDAIREELAATLGRNKRNFRLWQDQDAIAPGEMWEAKIASAINEATFFIPIVTPRSVGSEHCKFEFNAFLARENSLGRKNLIFPILYITVPALSEDSKWRGDPVLSIIGARQFVDWRKHRHAPIETPAFREAIGDFCAKVADALRQRWVSPEEQTRHEDDSSRQGAVVDRRDKNKTRLQETDDGRVQGERIKATTTDEPVQKRSSLSNTVICMIGGGAIAGGIIYAIDSTYPNRELVLMDISLEA
jgi:TIR domain